MGPYNAQFFCEKAFAARRAHLQWEISPPLRFFLPYGVDEELFLIEILALSYLTIIYIFGGDKRIRTADPLLAKQVLSQLSYTPL